jgi:hypothetical protein
MQQVEVVKRNIQHIDQWIVPGGHNELGNLEGVSKSKNSDKIYPISHGQK